MSMLNNKDLSSNQERKQEKKTPYHLEQKHRFEVGEDGTAIDYESERSEQETQDEFKKLQDEVIKNRVYEFSEKLFMIGVGCIIFASIYIWQIGLEVVPIIMFVIGVFLIVFFWKEVI